MVYVFFKKYLIHLDGRGCGDFGADQGAVVHVPQTDCYKLLIGTLKKKIKIKEKGRIAANLIKLNLLGNR